MPVPVKFINSVRDTTVIIDHRQNQQRTFINLGFVPDSVVIDPDLRIISANNNVNKLPDGAGGPASVLVFPNPVLSDANLITSNFSTGNYAFRLLNNKGQLLWSKSLTNLSGTTFMTIPMSHLPAGIYWLSITNGKTFKQVKKLLK